MATETPPPPPPGVVIEIPPPPETSPPIGMATETPPPPETSHPPGMATETPPPPETSHPPGMATETPPRPPPGVATETPTPPETSPPPGLATETPPPPPGVATKTPPGMARETPPPGVATKTPPGMATETPPSGATETPPGRCASIFNVIASTVSRHAFIFIVITSTIPFLGTGYFLASTLLLLRRGGDPKCEYPRLEWDLWFDVFLLLLFLAGSIGVSFKAKAVQITCITSLGVTALLIAVVSWSVDIGGTFPKDTKTIDDAYRLETYAPWAHKFLLKDSGWNTYQNCLMEKKICDKLDNWDFVQGGCCMPPSYCGYEDKNLTWVIPKTGRYAEDANCVRWDNDERKLCYDCETCQAVYVYTMKYNWTGRAFGTFVGAWVLVLCLALTFAEGGCENNRSRGRADNNRSV